MKRWLFLIYGVGCHLMFLVTFAYMAGFVGNVLVPKTIDTPSRITWPTALGINLMLLGVFAVQHSVMARPGFKQHWIRIVPQPIERSTYVLFSCAVTILMMVLWQGIDRVVWDVQNPGLRRMLWGLFAVGWLLVPVVSLLINHFDLFGTRQVWLYFRGEQYKSLEFRVPLFYKHVRHPLYIGWALAFWSIPTMTVGHLLFAGVLTVYMVGAAVIEERDLIAHFGEQYREYRRRVPMFLPRFGKLTSDEPVSEILKANAQ
jgi:protein-S-isoprenylcysteine O-methyltransferase Ste14